METAGKVITCRAAVTWKPSKPATIESVQVSPPKPNEIRVKMCAAGICYSDISLGSGRFPAMDFPTILGHEGVGVVESVGHEVTRFCEGDTVIPMWGPTCGQCALCKRGKRNSCKSTGAMMSGLLLDKTTRTTCRGSAVRQAAGLGLFSEYVVLPEIAAVKITTCASPEKLTPFGCCMPTGYGAAIKTACVDEGTTVAVWGLGAVGLCAVLGSKDSKAARIIGIDINPDKFELGRKFGCTDTLNPMEYDKSVPEILKEMTNGIGVDYAFVCVGNMDAMSNAFESCSFAGGECIIVGIGPHDATIPVNHYDLVNGKELKGSHAGDCFGSDIQNMVDKYYQGLLPTDLLITDVISLDQINSGFESLKNGSAIRTVIKF